MSKTGARYYDSLMSHAGMQIGVSGEMYFRQIGRNSYVFLEKFKREWIFWKENFIENSYSKTQKYKMIFKNSRVEFIARNVRDYLIDLELKDFHKKGVRNVK